MKETAVDWLIERINHSKIERILTTQRLYELKQIAKELEKEQILKAHRNGSNHFEDFTANEYYNKTY